jgi:zinc/manganese transport system permease protein
MNLAALDISILGPGMLAGLIVLATHVPLGREVLRRGIIFIDLAVAQAAGLGVIVAGVLGWQAHGIPAQACAIIAAMAAGLLLTWTESHFEEIQEAIIGVVFILAATCGILVLSNHPKGSEELRDLFSGQILWAHPDHLWAAAAVSSAVLAAWFLVRHHLGRAGFYVLFAFSVTASVQLVGVFLVFASLIVPAIAVRNLGPARGVWAGYGIGIAGYALGLVASALWDLPTGPIIVWTLTVAAIVTSVLRRN